MPGVYEVLFYNETEDSPGMMLWRYPEPRVLPLYSITPVPFNTTEDQTLAQQTLVTCCRFGMTLHLKKKHCGKALIR